MTDLDREDEALRASIAAREARDRLAERERQALEQEREAREAAARRSGLYAAAAEAAKRWKGPRAKTAMSAPVERLRRHVVDLALEDPIIELRWLAWGARSQVLVGHDNARALMRARVVLTPPVLDEWSYATALHELGHVRTNQSRSGKLHREVAAWRWCRAQAQLWSADCQQNMTEALDTYAAAAKGRDAETLLGLLEIEGLCSNVEYARERQRRVEGQIAEETARIAVQLAGRVCVICERAAATVVEGGRVYCDPCVVERRIEDLIAQQRRWMRTRAIDRKHGPASSTMRRAVRVGAASS